MKNLSLAGGRLGGAVQLISRRWPGLNLWPGPGRGEITGPDRGGWTTVSSPLASAVLNLGASVLTSHMMVPAVWRLTVLSWTVWSSDPSSSTSIPDTQNCWASGSSLGVNLESEVR